MNWIANDFIHFNQIISNTIVAPLSSIPCSDAQRAQRLLLSRSRLYAETKVYLNNSNCKWIAIGVSPNQREGGPIKKFETELFLGGDKSASVPIGGVVGFLQLVRQLRTIGYWQNMFLDVSNYSYVIIHWFLLFLKYLIVFFIFSTGKIDL